MSKPLTMTVEKEREYRARHTSGGTEVDPVFAELDATRAALTAAEARLAQWEEREAACCPEDFGFPEVIESLRAKLAQAQTDIDGWRHGFKCDFCAESEKKLVQAEQERDEARKESLQWMAHVDTADHEGMAHMEAAATSQARERELREEMAKMCAAMGWDMPKCARGPVDDAALREMLGECATDAVDRYIADGCTASEAASATVSRLLGGGK